MFTYLSLLFTEVKAGYDTVAYRAFAGQFSPEIFNSSPLIHNYTYRFAILDQNLSNVNNYNSKKNPKKSTYF